MPEPTSTAVQPPNIPCPREAVLMSSVFELPGAAGLLWRPTHRAAAWGLFVLTLAMTPTHFLHVGAGEFVYERAVLGAGWQVAFAGGVVLG